MQQKESITRMIGSTVRKVDPSAQVYLFGSRARGTARDDSDWDVLVIVDSPDVSEARRRVSYDLWLKGIELGQQINAFIYTHASWDNGKPSLFRNNVMQDRVAI